MNPWVCRVCAAVLFVLSVPAMAADCPRIVSQSPYLTRVLDWLGRGDCVVGVSRYERGREALPRTGGVRDPDTLAIDALEPDLVLISRGSDARLLAADLAPSTRIVQVDGFESMAATESMLRTVAQASGAADGGARVDAFARDWRAAARKVEGEGLRALVLSACSGEPYSFGRGHVVGDLFSHAGFEVVETLPRIRHLRAGEELPDILSAVARFQPDVVISLNRTTAEHCNAQLGMLPVRLVMLTGEHFFQPGPDMLQGLAELAERIK